MNVALRLLACLVLAPVVACSSTSVGDTDDVNSQIRARQACGGNMSPNAPACPTGTKCVADTNDACHTSGTTDCPGFCEAVKDAGSPQSCGGNMSPNAPACPTGTKCVADMNDACHTSGTTDCPGFCK